jgi:hypothetical protein
LLGFDEESLDAKTNEFLNSSLNDEHESSQDILNSNLNLNGGSFSVHQQNKIRTKSAIQANDNDDTFNDIARSLSPVNLRFDKDVENLISELLVLGQYEKVVDLLIQENRFTDAILIANFFDKNLLAKTQQIYFRQNSKNKFLNVRKQNIIRLS